MATKKPGSPQPPYNSDASNEFPFDVIWNDVLYLDAGKECDGPRHRCIHEAVWPLVYLRRDDSPRFQEAGNVRQLHRQAMGKRLKEDLAYVPVHTRRQANVLPWNPDY